MANYNFSDGDMTFAANGDTVLQLVNDPAGSFDIKNFSFLRSGNDLLIYADNGYVITLQNHYTLSSSYLHINYGTQAQPKLQVISDTPNISVGNTADASFGSNEHVFAGTGDNIITANASRIYAGSGDDVITNNSSGGQYTGNIIYAGDGNDTIYEGIGAGDDAWGGSGNDTFYANASAVNGSTWRGGAGDDTYHVNIKSSGTTIYDDSGTLDTLHFGAGLNFENFFMYNFSNGMTIVSKDTGALGVFQVTLKEQYTENIDKVVFADGTTYRIENGIDWYADDSDNEIDAAAGLYNLHGGLGNDIIRGATYVDTPEYGVHVTNWIPTLNGDEGDDLIYHGWTGIGGGAWGGESYGGTGDDVIHGTDYNDAMFGGDGNDTLYAYSHDDASDDIMDGGNGDDTFYIGTGTEKDVRGGAGWDVIYSELNSGSIDFSGANRTHLKGGADNDAYVFLRDDNTASISAAAWINDTSGNHDTIAFGYGFNSSNVNLQNLSITDLHSSLSYHMIDVNPNFVGNVIERLSFSDGSVYAWNGSGYNALTATNGDDNPIYLTAWHDRFDALAGDDVVYALEGDDVLLGNAGNDHFDGGTGIDTIDYSSSISSVVVNLRGVAWTYDGTNVVGANSAHDGFGGTDDLISIENIIGSAHDDYIYGTGSYSNTIHAGDGDDYVYTWGDDDVIYGEGGNDELIGGVGNDEIHGGTGNDVIYGYGDDDLIYGEEGADILRGSGGNDILDGGSGIDWLYGGDGDDTLISGGDRDHFYGNDGADTFVFKDIAYSNTTLIHDFDLTEGDAIDVSDLLKGFDASADNINDYMALAEAAGHAYVWADQNGTDAGGSILLARLTGVTGLDLDTMYLDGDIII